MDRKNKIAGSLVSLSLAVTLGSGCGSPAQQPKSFASNSSSEPARLELNGVSLTELRSPDGSVRAAGYPDWESQHTDLGPRRVPASNQPTARAANDDLDFSIPDVDGLEQTRSQQPPDARKHPEWNEPLKEQSAPRDSVRMASRAPVVTQSPTIAQVPVTAHAPTHAKSPAIHFKRTGSVVAAEVRANDLITDGFSLSQRGALFTARSQFLQALRTIASAQDEMRGNPECTRALNAGLKALDESHDFEVRHASNTVEIDVPTIVATHRTPVLKENAEGIGPEAAATVYQQYAAEQFAAAVGEERAATLAMYGLGRIHAATGKENLDNDPRHTIDAVVWHQAALLVDAKNFRAAHELGSLYAKRGEWEQARNFLRHAVAVMPQAATWNNLAVVHGKLGETDLAAAARNQALVVSNPEAATGKIPPIEWVDEGAFAKSTGPNEVFFPQQKAPPQTAERVAVPEPRSADKSAKSGWLGFPLRR